MRGAWLGILALLLATSCGGASEREREREAAREIAAALFRDDWTRACLARNTDESNEYRAWVCAPSAGPNHFDSAREVRPHTWLIQWESDFSLPSACIEVTQPLTELPVVKRHSDADCSAAGG